MVRTETVLESWKTVREDTALAVEEFPADEMNYKPTPELSTFGEIARHILDAGEGLTGVLLAGEENLATPQFRESMKKHFAVLPEPLDPKSLAAALRETVAARVVELSAQPSGFFEAMITRFDGQRVTRLEMLQFVKEHELTHRAQLFMYMRLKGLVPATTRRRLAKQAGK